MRYETSEKRPNSLVYEFNFERRTDHVGRQAPGSIYIGKRIGRRARGIPNLEWKQYKKLRDSLIPFQTHLAGPAEFK